MFRTPFQNRPQDHRQLLLKVLLKILIRLLKARLNHLQDHQNHPQDYQNHQNHHRGVPSVVTLQVLVVLEVLLTGSPIQSLVWSLTVPR